MSEKTKAKSRWGGRRPGAGRKPGCVGRKTAIEILTLCDEVSVWIALLRSGDSAIRRRVRDYLQGRSDDRAQQALILSALGAHEIFFGPVDVGLNFIDLSNGRARLTLKVEGETFGNQPKAETSDSETSDRTGAQ